MKAEVRTSDWRDAPESVRPFISPSQTFVSNGREYEVHAISAYQNITFFLVVDDLGTPVFLPSWLFSVTTQGLPQEWICNTDLGGGVDLILGPEFIARSLESYSALVDQETQALDLFWKEARHTKLQG